MKFTPRMNRDTGILQDYATIYKYPYTITQSPLPVQEIKRVSYGIFLKYWSNYETAN